MKDFIFISNICGYKTNNLNCAAIEVCMYFKCVDIIKQIKTKITSFTQCPAAQGKWQVIYICGLNEMVLIYLFKDEIRFD